MDKDAKFWNDNNNVEYFKSKAADPIIVKYLDNIAGDSSEMNALDLGCGGGRHTELLCRKGWNTFSVDINLAMLQATTERVAQLCLKKMPQVSTGEITAIPFEDSFFDLVVTTGVLHQARSQKEYRQALSELSRVCKKDAVILLNIFTNSDTDPTYTFLDEAKTVVQTKEGLLMTLLAKELFYEMMSDAGIYLEEEYIEELKQENTGPRTVLRARFKKE